MSVNKQDTKRSWYINGYAREVKILEEHNTNYVKIRYLDDGTTDKVGVFFIYSEYRILSMIRAWNLDMELFDVKEDIFYTNYYRLLSLKKLLTSKRL